MFTQSPITATPTLDQTEPGSSYRNPINVTIGKTIGEIIDDKDKYYNFTPPVPGIYTVAILGEDKNYQGMQVDNPDDDTQPSTTLGVPKPDFEVHNVTSYLKIRIYSTQYDSANFILNIAPDQPQYINGDYKFSSRLIKGQVYTWNYTYITSSGYRNTFLVNLTINQNTPTLSGFEFALIEGERLYSNYTGEFASQLNFTIIQGKETLIVTNIFEMLLLLLPSSIVYDDDFKEDYMSIFTESYSNINQFGDRLMINHTYDDESSYLEYQSSTGLLLNGSSSSSSSSYTITLLTDIVIFDDPTTTESTSQLSETTRSTNEVPTSQSKIDEIHDKLLLYGIIVLSILSKFAPLRLRNRRD
ncbi:MAG: hypothetical protein ACXAD7_12040 [Candidatus Kariarchaeaceae archaeon]